MLQATAGTGQQLPLRSPYSLATGDLCVLLQGCTTAQGGSSSSSSSQGATCSAHCIREQHACGCLLVVSDSRCCSLSLSDAPGTQQSCLQRQQGQQESRSLLVSGLCKLNTGGQHGACRQSLLHHSAHPETVACVAHRRLHKPLQLLWLEIHPVGHDMCAGSHILVGIGTPNALLGSGTGSRGTLLPSLACSLLPTHRQWAGPGVSTCWTLHTRHHPRPQPAPWCHPAPPPAQDGHQGSMCVLHAMPSQTGSEGLPNNSLCNQCLCVLHLQGCPHPCLNLPNPW